MAVAAPVVDPLMETRPVPTPEEVSEYLRGDNAVQNMRDACIIVQADGLWNPGPSNDVMDLLDENTLMRAYWLLEANPRGANSSNHYYNANRLPDTVPGPTPVDPVDETARLARIIEAKDRLRARVPMVPAEVRSYDDWLFNRFFEARGFLSQVATRRIAAGQLVQPAARLTPTAPSASLSLNSLSTSTTSLGSGYQSVKKWYTNGAIPPHVSNQYYYIDPMENQDVVDFTKDISTNKLLLFTGARASGKTTRCLRIVEHLTQNQKFICIHISLESISRNNSFWRSLGATLAIALKHQSIAVKAPRTKEDIERLCSNLPASSKRRFVIFIDEFNELFNLDQDLQADVLRMLRNFRDNDAYNLCIIGIGTFSIRFLTSNDIYVSPFNLGASLQNPELSLSQVRFMFDQYSRDQNITFEGGIIEDIYFGTNGHAGLISLIGSSISRLIQEITPEDGIWHFTLVYWLRFSFDRLHTIMDSYMTFKRLRDILLSSRATLAMNFLRKQLLGSLDPIIIGNPASDEHEYAKFLAAEGVLKCSNTDTRMYSMSSPYLDSLLRRCVLPALWPSPVSQKVPTTSNGCADIYTVMKIAIKYFDGGVIRSGYDRSYKKYKGTAVPRESVYDTETIRILMNWLPAGKGLTITGQWHLVDNGAHRYSDIVVSNEDGSCRTVIELLASGTNSEVTSHIAKTPVYQRLLAANNALIVHFTTDRSFTQHPNWSGVPSGVDIAHVYHDREFSVVEWTGMRWINGVALVEAAAPIELAS